MTSISHPLIFGILVLCDVLENAFCLWSLHRTMSGLSTRSNKIAPEQKEEDENVLYSNRKTLTKRSTSVYNLMKDLDATTSTQERQGTALFIAAILLQREMIETFVPIQAMGIISILYSSDVKSNSVVSRWESVNEYNQTMMYMGIDLGVEIVVFVLTTLTLRKIFPNVSAWRVLSSLLKIHTYPMVMVMCMVWYCGLIFQRTQFGMDTTFRFSWIKCDGNENSTWLGGFDWEC